MPDGANGASRAAVAICGSITIGIMVVLSSPLLKSQLPNLIADLSNNSKIVLISDYTEEYTEGYISLCFIL